MCFIIHKTPQFFHSVKWLFLIYSKLNYFTQKTVKYSKFFMILVKISSFLLKASNLRCFWPEFLNIKNY